MIAQGVAGGTRSDVSAGDGVVGSRSSAGSFVGAGVGGAVFAGGVEAGAATGVLLTGCGVRGGEVRGGRAGVGMALGLVGCGTDGLIEAGGLTACGGSDPGEWGCSAMTAPVTVSPLTARVPTVRR